MEPAGSELGPAHGRPLNAAWALAVLPAATLAMTLVNLATWRRPGRGSAGPHDTVSVLVPARNEAARIGPCLDAIAASTPPVDEILVYDDESTDETGEIVASRAARDGRIRLVPTEPLPEGWVGKSHACERLSRAATCDVLVFLDADVRVAREGIAGLTGVLQDGATSLVTAVPRQEMGTLTERVLLPLLLVTYLSWLPLELVARSKDPRIVAANGQVLALRRSALAPLEHFRCVASEVVDDVALCRAAKAVGLRVAFVDGTEMATCRMYTSGRALWDGFSKNIAEGVGGAAGVALAVLLYVAAFFAPWAVLVAAAVGMAPPVLAGPALAGVVANVVQRAIIALRFRQPILGVAAHPVAIAALVVLALRSLGWSLRGRVRWSGRVYAARSERKLAA